MTRTTRRQRRQSELAARRDKRRTTRGGRQQRSLLVPISLGALALGVVTVIVFALVQPPAEPSGQELRAPLLPAPYELADGRALGHEEAPVTVEVWSDFQCVACASFAETAAPRLIDEYVATGQVRLVYRDFAFLGNESFAAASGARCAAEQNGFWQFHDYLFANHQGVERGAFTTGRLEQMAQAAGLALEAYRACQAGGGQRQAVSAETAEGRAMGVSSTPTIDVAGRRFVGVPQYEELRAAVEAALVARARGEAPAH